MPDKRISVILAHPDDESFGMGGTLAKYAAQNVSIHVDMRQANMLLRRAALLVAASPSVDRNFVTSSLISGG